jgi:menaquinone-dependent protoporphyrinogen oxidase
MPRLILVAHATKHGSTRDVAEAIAATLREHDLDVDERSAADHVDVDAYDGVVLGGALYTGRLHPDARRFLRRHRDALTRIPLAVFAMGPRTLDQKDVESSRQQLDRELAKLPEIEPEAIAIFGGVVEPSTLHFPLNRMPASDARDWSAIRAWAEDLAGLFRRAAGWVETRTSSAPIR